MYKDIMAPKARTIMMVFIAIAMAIGPSKVQAQVSYGSFVVKNTVDNKVWMEGCTRPFHNVLSSSIILRSNTKSFAFSVDPSGYQVGLTCTFQQNTPSGLSTTSVDTWPRTLECTIYNWEIRVDEFYLQDGPLKYNLKPKWASPT